MRVWYFRNYETTSLYRSGTLKEPASLPSQRKLQICLYSLLTLHLKMLERHKELFSTWYISCETSVSYLHMKVKIKTKHQSTEIMNIFK